VDQDLVIITPEKTILSYRLAGLGSRVNAHIVDLIAVAVIMMVLGYGSFAVLSMVDSGLAMGVMLALIGIVPFAYFILLEGLWNGQTLGKRSLGIRVRMADGTPITMTAAIGRNLLRPADMLPGPYFFGLVAMFLNPKSQRIGDLVANTVVCYETRPSAGFAPAPHMMGTHPLEGEVGDLKGMTLDEYQALRRMCDRFPEFSGTIQQKMIKEVWEPLAIKLRVPTLSNVHPIYMAEAVVMKYGRKHGLL